MRPVRSVAPRKAAWVARAAYKAWRRIVVWFDFLFNSAMPVYVAMLRGINVSGHKPVKMERLRVSIRALGFDEVATYIQSGNVVFKAAKDSNRSLEQKIAKRILEEFGFEVPVVVRSSDELADVVRRSPFSGQPGFDETKLHVTFLAEAAPKTATDVLKSLAQPSEKFAVSGREIYLSFPNGYGVTKLSNTAIENKLGVTATTRNWKTVNVLRQMAFDS